MTLAFNEETIHGTHEEPKFSEWDVQMQMTRQFGLKGATILAGEQTTREIRIHSWIHNDFSTVEELNTYLDSLHAKFRELGTLAEAGKIVRTTENVFFKSILQNQGPFPPTTIGWFVDVTMVFIQLGPGGEEE